MAPLSALTSKDTPWKWGQEQEEAFEEIKKVISKETLLAFPRFDKPFHVYTDASNYQLGAVIMQEGKPLAFYSRKLNGAQKNYTTGEQELLSIVETLKEFRNILLGQQVIVHTDHKNILYGNLTNDRIIRWRLLLEEFAPEYRHIAGEKNVVADALSRVHMKDDSTADEKAKEVATCMCILIRDESTETPEPTNLQDMATCFAGSEEIEFEQFPMRPSLLAQKDPEETPGDPWKFHTHESRRQGPPFSPRQDTRP